MENGIKHLHLFDLLTFVLPRNKETFEEMYLQNYRISRPLEVR